MVTKRFPYCELVNVPTHLNHSIRSAVLSTSDKSAYVGLPQTKAVQLLAKTMIAHFLYLKAIHSNKQLADFINLINFMLPKNLTQISF